MAKHDKLTGLMQPMERFARAINNSSAVARSTQTGKAGSIYIPNADGTATIIGEAAGVDETGAPAGRADFYGDTTPPSAPTGITWTSESGAITGYWDGTLAEGVPADFSYVELRVDGESTLAGRLKVAGSTSAVELTVGSSYDCYAVAVDVQGNVSAESEHTSVVVVNTVETVEADVSEVKDKAAALEAELDTTNQKVTQVVSDVEGVKTTAENAVEKADQSLTVATEAKQTATEVKTTADKAYADAESALTQSSEAKQTASELSGKVTEAVETANSAKTSATTAVQTVDSFKTEVSETYLTKDDAGTTYATKSSLTETADSITAKVEAAQATGDEALVKSTEVEQTVEGITTTVAGLTEDMTEQQTLIRQSGNGVEVARKVDGAYTSTRTLMDDEGFHVLSSDGTELSSFGADTVELGKGNSNARIKLVNGQFVVYAGTKDSQAAGYLTSTDIMELLALNDYGNAMVNLHTGTKDANNSSINFQVNTMVDGALHKTASAVLAVSEVNNSSSLTLNVDKVLTTRKSVFDLAYPVGAVYISYVSTSPASLFGGTWEQLTGVFLRAANDTNTGGADSVSHYHWQTLGTYATEKNVYIAQGENNDGLSARVIRATKINIIDAYGSNATGSTRQDTTYSTTVNNMPTYQDVYAWRRTA